MGGVCSVPEAFWFVFVVFHLFVSKQKVHPRGLDSRFSGYLKDVKQEVELHLPSHLCG